MDKGERKQPDECKCWWRLEEKIADAFPEAYWSSKGKGAFPHAPPGVKWNIGKLPTYETMLGNPNGFEADLLRIEKPLVSEIETVIRARCSGRSVPTSTEVQYWLAVRAYVVLWYVGRLEIAREVPGSEGATETIIPFPDALPWPRIIEWLLIDWWKENGPWIAALLRLEKMHTGLEPENSGDDGD